MQWRLRPQKENEMLVLDRNSTAIVHVSLLRVEILRVTDVRAHFVFINKTAH